MGISSAKLSKLMKSYDPKKKNRKGAGDLSHLFEAGKATSSPTTAAAPSSSSSKQDDLAAFASEDDFEFLPPSTEVA